MYSQRNFSFPVLFLFWNRSFTNRYIYSLFSFIYLSDGQRTLFEKRKSSEQLGIRHAKPNVHRSAICFVECIGFHSDETASISQYNAILPLSIFIFNWVNDTGAYCTGMLFGKHKLFERISPKKSWEGSIGGSVFCIISSFILAHFFPFMSTGVWIGLALTVVIFGTWGDLTESLLKRRLGIKDSGNILPGHGGMLDRFDSAILAIPAAVVYLYVVSLF